jgi:hypothetical protein
MAHFARVEDGVVTEVLVVSDEHETDGNGFLNGIGLDGVWVQTSYNTYGGLHSQGGIPLRYNYAGVGFTYDSVRDAFIPPKPYPSWVLDEDTCLWVAPVPYPDEGFWLWDEDAGVWVDGEGV